MISHMLKRRDIIFFSLFSGRSVVGFAEGRADTLYSTSQTLELAPPAGPIGTHFP